MPSNAMYGDIDAIVAQIARIASAQGVTISVAESLTGGQLSAALCAAEESSGWFRGGIVAYDSEVKFTVLGVPRGPVVTAAAARSMARGARVLLGADFSVSVTGVGGPKTSEGKPVGTVYTSVDSASMGLSSKGHCFRGEPIEVLNQTLEHALRDLLDALRLASAAADS